MAQRLVVKLTAGADAPERCVQALTVAAAAVASGISVAVWLTGEAAWLAVPDRAAEIVLAHSAPVDDLMQILLDGADVVLCTQCAARRELTSDDIFAAVRIAGAQSFVEAVVADDVQALIY